MVVWVRCSSLPCESRNSLYGFEDMHWTIVFWKVSLKSDARGVHSQEMPGTEVPLGWVAIFELRYRDGS